MRPRLPQLSPAHQVALSFLLLIAVGTGLLLTPAATPPGQPLSLVDALFTATSAACVTGLVVRDTGTGFTPFGQGVILALIQLGGLGIMTLSLAVFTLGGRLSLGKLSLVEQTLAGTGDVEVRALLRLVFLSTLAIEAAGALLLWAAWAGPLGAAGALWPALFHAVSAFCNAGFALWGDSLTRFAGSAATQLVVMALVVAGGLGFLVLHDLATRGRRRLGLHAKLALAVSGLLALGGMILLLALERGTSFAPLSPSERLLAAGFQSVSARTAGFNTVDVALLSPASLWLLMGLMLVGGSPGSCAGGIKTTTAAIVAATTRARLLGRQHVNLFYRTLPPRLVQTAFALTTLALVSIALGLFALLVLEGEAVRTGRISVLDLAFETVSALGTVGLSTGTTTELGGASRLVVSLLMFAARVGPLTLAAVVVGDAAPGGWRHREEKVMVG